MTKWKLWISYQVLRLNLNRSLRFDTVLFLVSQNKTITWGLTLSYGDVMWTTNSLHLFSGLIYFFKCSFLQFCFSLILTLIKKTTGGFSLLILFSYLGNLLHQLYWVSCVCSYFFFSCPLPNSLTDQLFNGTFKYNFFLYLENKT